ncbi:MAG: 3-dehydroquinate synthase [Candidatus Nanopelagicales bacterium]
MPELSRIPVVAEGSYDVVIGRGLLDELPPLVHGATRVAIIHPDALRVLAEDLGSRLADQGFAVTMIDIPEAEDAKTAAVLAACWDRLGSAGFTRSDAVVGVGGGATTDLAGFVAATWLRGIRVVHVPTSLLGMVDAAVGGKTGINTAAGKNLVGAFHSPSGVLCDLDTLLTLPREDLIAGMAEVVKVGFTSDPTILDDVRRGVEPCIDPRGDLIADLVRRAVAVKAAVVSADFREESATGASRALGREVLNYGHTFGHAVERVEGYRWRHGAAVSVGLRYVAELARAGGRLSDAAADEHLEILTLLGLPTDYPAGRWAELVEAMQVDKKARGSLLRFVVLEGIGSPVTWEGPDPELLVRAYEAISR